MKIFLSWSGDVSKMVAVALYDWLPNVIQALEPWISSNDIPKGRVWTTELADSLNSIGAGIICVTPDNQNASYLNFEAGALAKTVDRPMVCTYLIGMKPSEVIGPLSSFQSTEANKEETFKLIQTLNTALGDGGLPEGKLTAAFERWWPDLDNSLSRILSTKTIISAERPTNDMVEEILDLVRNMTNGLSAIGTMVKSQVSSSNVWLDSTPTPTQFQFPSPPHFYAPTPPHFYTPTPSPTPRFGEE